MMRQIDSTTVTTAAVDDRLIVRVLFTASLVGSTQNASLFILMIFLFRNLKGVSQVIAFGVIRLCLTDFNQLDIQLSSQEHFQGFLPRLIFVAWRLTAAMAEGSDCS